MKKCGVKIPARHCEPAKRVWQSPSGWREFNRLRHVTLRDCRVFRARNDDVKVFKQTPRGRPVLAGSCPLFHLSNTELNDHSRSRLPFKTLFQWVLNFVVYLIVV